MKGKSKSLPFQIYPSLSAPDKPCSEFFLPHFFLSNFIFFAFHGLILFSLLCYGFVFSFCFFVWVSLINGCFFLVFIDVKGICMLLLEGF